MIECEDVLEVPDVKRNFVPSEETKQIEALMGMMKVGDIKRFPSETTLQERNKLFSKCVTAKKYSIGEYKIYQRGFNVFVERIN